VKLQFSPYFEKRLKEISKRDKSLLEKINKQFNLFVNNPRHPSLRMHKLEGGLDNFWSISVNRSIRMIYREIEDTAYFTDIGKHEEVYKK